MNQSEITAYLHQLGDTKIASKSQRYFKTSKGEYGFGDEFLGIRMPVIREAVRRFTDTPLDVTSSLLTSKYHEIRLFSILQLVAAFSRGNAEQKREIFELYLNNTQFINSWDLVDSSAHYIVGSYLVNGDTTVLQELSRSKSLWERRIAIIATFFYIKQNEYSETLKLAKILLNDNEDLIHKAVGWMLREVGKRDLVAEKHFLKSHYKKMPRTMLRYAIEKFDEKDRQEYLQGKI